MSDPLSSYRAWVPDLCYWILCDYCQISWAPEMVDEAISHARIEHGMSIADEVEEFLK